MKNLIRKIKNLSRIQMHFVWFYLAAFLLSALVLLSCNFWYKNRMTEYAVRSSQNTLQLHINAEHLCPAALSLRQYQRTFVLCPMVGCLSHEKQPD